MAADQNYRQHADRDWEALQVVSQILGSVEEATRVLHRVARAERDQAEQSDIAPQ